MARWPAQARFEEAVAAYQSATTAEDYGRALDLLSTVRHSMNDLPPENQRSAMLLSAECMRVLGRHADAEALLRELIRDLRGDASAPPGMGEAASLSLAQVLCATGEWREAVTLFQTAAARFRQIGDWQSEAGVHRTVAYLWQGNGQLDRANDELDAALRVLEPHDPTQLHLQVLFAKGHCCYLAGEGVPAITFQERALAVARRIGDAYTEAQLVHNLAVMTFEVQDFQRAIHYNDAMLKGSEALEPEEAIRCMSCLGACYAETGCSRRAIECFDGALDMMQIQGQGGSAVAGTCLLGKAEALVDLKQYREAETHLLEARALLIKARSDTTLLERIAERIARENQGPMSTDCAHRVLQMVLAGGAHQTVHQHPQPVVSLTKLQHLTSDLTDDDRAYLAALRNELDGELFQTRYLQKADPVAPGAFILPIKYEYVEDVEAFELKWSAYKRELEYARQGAVIQTTWEAIAGKFAPGEGVFRGGSDQWSAYVSELAQIAEFSGELGDRDMLRDVALHAADFLELHTDSPALAAIAWTTRARLMTAAHALSPTGSRELVEVELRRSLSQAREALALLSGEPLEAVLGLIVEPWFRAALNALGRDGYRELTQAVGGLAASLAPADHLRYAIALGEASDPARGVSLADAVLAQISEQNPGMQVTLATELGSAVAALRFRATAPDAETCRRRYGPFAPYIHGEVCNWTRHLYAMDSGEGPTAGLPPLAFTDGNLVVMDRRLEGESYAATMVHEMSHQLLQVGQKLRTERGDWLSVKRDTPTASAFTCLLVLKPEISVGSGGVASEVGQLVSQGQRAVERDPELTHVHISNMLRYFDDLGRHETHASYPCAAILLGMAFGYLRDPDAVRSYIEHLSVMDHEEAVSCGRRKATLKW